MTEKQIHSDVSADVVRLLKARNAAAHSAPLGWNEAPIGMVVPSVSVFSATTQQLKTQDNAVLDHDGWDATSGWKEVR